LNPRLATALGLVAEAAREARDPWWVIGSAAVALHGADVDVGDIDLLMSRTDAAWLLASQEVAVAPGAPDVRFRSDVFGRWICGSYTVEVMGGFHVRDGADWRELVPSSRAGFAVGATRLFAPSVEELIGICGLFGRPKDFQRQMLLEEPRLRSGRTR
jgi:hypothetical protein